MELETISNSKKYCNDLTSYSRFKTREVRIGNVPLGGNNPIRLQSMTTTDTMDTIATVEQSIRMIEAGSEYVRITAPSKNEAENLLNIKNELRKRGYDTPLIADIHFTPNAAEIAARIVEKVRVNPGNYADKKKFQVYNYTDDHYKQELDRIREKFTPLVKICKEYGTAMRIGTNHGSLSDRIMSRYGDTPLGMVESAMEFVRICEDNDYHEIVLSMKASNPIVMVQAYRLLLNKMLDEGMNYPVHIGVTEAGDGEDGRVKSALGIGTLLEDGIGDTVRVSLTEEPEFEIPVCRELVDRYEKRAGHKYIPPVVNYDLDPFNYTRRKSNAIDNIGGTHVPVVVLTPPDKDLKSPENFSAIGYDYDPALDKWNIGDMAPDYIYLGDRDIKFELPGSLKRIYNFDKWNSLENKTDSFPLFTSGQFLDIGARSEKINFVSINADDVYNTTLIEALRSTGNVVLILSSDNEHAMPEMRRAFIELNEKVIDAPVIIKRSYETGDDEFVLYASTDAGGLFVDGLGDGIWLESSAASPGIVNRIAFGILQASRTRISKTEYISCPSCGRTLFDLQETTAMIRGRTSHLKGVKIAIMGCIVNGPGEMADADYGYVGSGPGKITLYKGKEVVKRGVNSENALDELIGLIKDNGDWIDPAA
ncbi:MAG: (E)-4-hydroxy-3-methylbut-2-enyl-diphosphate synthase [Ignavibacteriae bacterium]|nr:(E)-4-hydroxy-3-methylbut-2-enyl-diphosphate synthase [Ignavibacteriota bacterium]MCB9243916.1 (E)-4-hydroxy-3-methylbut-2-enyl-diphosphate synthase [Ignavibacteriales bacterium]